MDSQELVRPLLKYKESDGRVPIPRMLEDLRGRFTYHKPQEDQPDRYNWLRSEAHHLALAIVGYCPNSRERSLALTKLEEAIMWANAAIARNE